MEYMRDVLAASRKASRIMVILASRVGMIGLLMVMRMARMLAQISEHLPSYSPYSDGIRFVR